jgi:dTDP-4-amino-4,6-dideoxygalactose transaminase
MPVPLFDPATPVQALRDEVQEAVARVLDRGQYLLGAETQAFEEEFAAFLGARHAAGVANGTEAITLALRALGVGPGDDVVVPSFTFWASAEAVVNAGARPVFCDIDPATFVTDADKVRAALTPATKAVIVVHLFGNVVDVAPVLALGLPVLEDAAQSAGSQGPAGRPGALGTIATFSFYPSKNLGAFGDAGAVVTGDDELAETVRVLRFHGSRDKVGYERIGFNSRIDELQAAILRVQLPHLDAWAAHRAQAGRWYEEAGIGAHAAPPVATAGADPAWHLYVVRVPDPDVVVEHLSRAGVAARGYYRTPIHEQPAMRGVGHVGADLAGTDEAARTHLAIPISAAITREQVEDVVAAFAPMGA